MILRYLRKAFARYANEKRSNSVQKAIEGIVSWTSSAVLGLCAFLYWDLLEVWSWQFWAMAVFGGFLIVSLFRRQWKVAAAELCLALGLLTWICLNASYFIASDQSRYRIRSVEGVTYFEFRSENPISKFIAAKFPAKMITLNDCDGQKIAQLPLLPFQPIRPPGPTFSNRISYRRLPALKVNSIEASFEGGVGLYKDKWGDTKHTISLQFGFHDLEFKPLLLTEIFPRSLGCVVDLIPLLPVLEVLPWDPENVGDLIKSARRAAQLLDVGTNKKVTLKELDDLRSGLAPNKYGSLLDFVAHSLAQNMLDGNILAEAKAQVIEGQCNLIDRDVSYVISLCDPLRVRIVTDRGESTYHFE